MKIADIIRIWTYKNIFAKGYTPNWSEDIFVIKKVKNTVLGTYVINDPNGKEIIGIFYKNKSKTNQKQFRVEKVLRKKGDKCMLNEKDTIIPLIAT